MSVHLQVQEFVISTQSVFVNEELICNATWKNFGLQTVKQTLCLIRLCA